MRWDREGSRRGLGLKLGGRRTEARGRRRAERRARRGPSGGWGATCRAHGQKALVGGAARIQVPLSTSRPSGQNAARRQRREVRDAGQAVATRSPPHTRLHTPTTAGVGLGMGGGRALQISVKSQSHWWHAAQVGRRATEGLQMAWKRDLGGSCTLVGPCTGRSHPGLACQLAVGAPRLSLGVQPGTLPPGGCALGQPRSSLPASMPARSSGEASAGRPRRVDSPTDRLARQQTDRPGWRRASCVTSCSGCGRLCLVRAAILRGCSPPHVCRVAAVWRAVAAVSGIVWILTAWWRAARDEAHQSVQPNDEAASRGVVRRACSVSKVLEVLQLDHAILAERSPDPPAPAAGAAPAVQQGTHRGRRVVVGQGARPILPVFPRIVSKRGRDRQLGGRAPSLESRYDRGGKFRDDQPPGPQGVETTPPLSPEPRVTPVAGRIAGIRPQAVIHVLGIQHGQQPRPRAAGQSGLPRMRSDYSGCFRSSGEGVAAIKAVDPQACMHDPRR